MSKLKYHEIKAVHETELKRFLQDLGLLKGIEEGAINCNFCSRKITLANLQCVYPKNNEIKICCDDVRCFEKAVKDSGGKK